MSKRILSITLLTTLVIVGCSSTGDAGFASALNKFANVLEGATPFIQESEAWEQYSIDKTKQGVVYKAASDADEQFVTRKMNTEYAAAIDRLSRPFALNDQAKKELNDAGKDYQFKYNKIIAVQDKNSSNVIGYCVNYDARRIENGQLTPLDAQGNVQKSFIYVAKDRPISVATVGNDFTKLMCGTSFFNQYKG